MRILIGLMGVFLLLPISYFLQYKILTMIGATEVMWMLYWISIPLLCFVLIANAISGAK